MLLQQQEAATTAQASRLVLIRPVAAHTHLSRRREASVALSCGPPLFPSSWAVRPAALGEQQAAYQGKRRWDYEAKAAAARSSFPSFLVLPSSQARGSPGPPSSAQERRRQRIVSNSKAGGRRMHLQEEEPLEGLWEPSGEETAKRREASFAEGELTPESQRSCRRRAVLGLAGCGKGILSRPLHCVPLHERVLQLRRRLDRSTLVFLPPPLPAISSWTQNIIHFPRRLKFWLKR